MVWSLLQMYQTYERKTSDTQGIHVDIENYLQGSKQILVSWLHPCINTETHGNNVILK